MGTFCSRKDDFLRSQAPAAACQQTAWRQMTSHTIRVRQGDREVKIRQSDRWYMCVRASPFIATYVYMHGVGQRCLNVLCASHASLTSISIFRPSVRIAILFHSSRSPSVARHISPSGWRLEEVESVLAGGKRMQLTPPPSHARHTTSFSCA